MSMIYMVFTEARATYYFKLISAPFVKFWIEYARDKADFTLVESSVNFTSETLIAVNNLRGV